MKPTKYTLRMPPYKFAPAAGTDFNTAILQPKTWANVPLRERDRSLLPVLHHRGYANAAFGLAVDAPPVGTNPPSYVEPNPYWGKTGRLLKTPRSIVFNAGAWMNILYQSAADRAALAAGGVFYTKGSFASHPGYNGVLAQGIPWASYTVGTLGAGASGVLPNIDRTTFVAGDVLSIFVTTLEYYDSLDFNPYDPAGYETTLISHDASQVGAALPSFRSFRVRIYSGNLAGDADLFNNHVVPAALAAGIDASYTGRLPTLADLQNDYHGFFGI